MYLNINSLQTKALYFKDQILSSLTSQQKKILIVAAVAFSCIAALFLYCKCCFKGTVDKKDPKDQGDAKAQLKVEVEQPKVDEKTKKSHEAFRQAIELICPWDHLAGVSVNPSFSVQQKKERDENLKKAIEDILPEHIDAATVLRDGMMSREQTLLLHAIMMIDDPARRLEIVEILLDKGADPDVEGFYYQPVKPMEEAARAKDPQLLELLVNAKNKKEAKKAQEQADAKKAQDEADAKNVQDEAGAKKVQEQKVQEQADAKKAQDEAVAKKAQDDADAKKVQDQKVQEQADAKKAQDEAVAKKAQDAAEADAKKAQEEADAKNAQDAAEADAKKAQDDADAKKAPQKTAMEIEAESDPIKKKLLDAYGPQMVEALGGLEKMKTFPTLTNWKGTLRVDDLKAPVMIGNRNGTPFLLFCYIKRDEEHVPHYPVKEYFDLNGCSTGEYIERTPEGWKGAYATQSELNLRDPNAIKEGSLDEKHMLDRVRRLMNAEPVGILKSYEDFAILKPADKETIRPDDSYLKGDEMTAYMDLATIFYEREVEEGSTDLYLIDPVGDLKSQGELFKARFPNA